MSLDFCEAELLSDRDYRIEYIKANSAIVEIWVVSQDVANMLKDVIFSEYNMLWYQHWRDILVNHWLLDDYKEKFTRLVDYTLSLERNLEQVTWVEDKYNSFKSQFPKGPWTNENYNFIYWLI